MADRPNSTPKVPGAWTAPLPHHGVVGDLLSWWATFRDPSLIGLIAIAEADNPDVEIAKARIEGARAASMSARAGRLPSSTSTTSVVRSGTGGDQVNRSPAVTTATAGLDAAWELDLFGKARRRHEAAALRVDERTTDWHALRVSLAAEVADYYLQYRACRLLEASHVADLTSLRDTVRTLETAEASGFRSNGDLALARASAASASITASTQRTECELLIKSLTRVTGGEEGRVRDLLGKGRSEIPRPSDLSPSAVPADALRQRPDILVAQLEVVATRAEIGVAEADRYPSLTLGGSIRISGASVLGTAVPWSFGPTLSIPVLDGGARSAAVSSAAALHDAAVATYEARVLDAVAEIESILVRLDGARRRVGDADVAARNYRAYFRTVDANWKAGGASLLDREEARRSSRQAEVLLIEIKRDRVRQWIALYKALGGGWAAAAPPAGGRQT